MTVILKAKMNNFEPSIVATTNTMQGPWSQPSERQLVELTASGDGEAFAVICSRLTEFRSYGIISEFWLSANPNRKGFYYREIGQSD